MALNFANNNSLSAITSLPASISGGGMTLISTQTASSSSTIDFTSGIDDTYDSYVFKFIDIHGSSDDTFFQVNFRDGGTNYDATKTTSVFRTYHFEDDSTSALAYVADHDLQQSTGVQKIAQGISTDNDHCVVGFLKLFSPNNSTFVKHFIVNTQNVHATNASYEWFVSGYNNTTNIIDGAQFSMSAGAIESGVIKLYGIS